jgi:hypothetical protein
MGAPWPASAPKGGGSGVPAGAPDPRLKHWSFQPVRSYPAPPVKTKGWVRSPIDAFILVKLEANRLRPNPPADRRTLIRRATFDLTGLPPKPEEVEAFVADRAPDAYEKLIDRLLASPAYGERWGRHWLDVVRYADSNGLDWNEVFPNAWRYRDYVIRSFNQDKPFDQFILEQLAGDLLPAASESESYEHLVATGMLVMGPKLLAQQDRIKLGMDVVDEQIDVTCKAFMGLTVSCARCHDHKFDPIPTRDYYALAGIFKSTVALKGTLPRNDRVMYWNERPLAPADQVQASEAYAAKVKTMEAAVKACKDPAEKTRLTAELAGFQKNAPPAPAMTMAVSEGRIADCPVHLRGSYANLGPEVPRGFVTALGGQKEVTDRKQSGRRELADWIASPRNPLTARVLANRLWLHHFGEGLVRTPDDFGARGERPTHPELLDYLAREVVRNGWRLKALHREIMLSAAYRMSSDPNPAAYAKDPDNRLVWRMNRVRLEAEAIRDAMLDASGSLDATVGGSLMSKTSGFPVKEFPVDFESRRRSVYLPSLRVVTYDLLKVFDFAEPSIVIGKRNRTTVATQALVMLNSPFVTGRSRDFAQSLLALPDADDRRRVEAAYLRALGRTPSTGEVDRAVKFLDDYQQALQPKEPDAEKRRGQAWASFCQTLFASTEFRYLD